MKNEKSNRRRRIIHYLNCNNSLSGCDDENMNGHMILMNKEPKAEVSDTRDDAMKYKCSLKKSNQFPQFPTIL